MKLSRRRLFLAASLLLLLFTPASADGIAGADVLLCSSVHATVCTSDGECVSGPPWNWNVPQFIVIDLAAKQLRTTEASGERRMTPIKNLERADGALYLQGVENGRAFSFSIIEADGSVSVAVARDGVTVSVFGACTPK